MITTWKEFTEKVSRVFKLEGQKFKGIISDEDNGKLEELSKEVQEYTKKELGYD